MLQLSADRNWRRCAAMLTACALLVGSTGWSWAQQLPAGLSPDQLMQQYQQQRENGAAGLGQPQGTQNQLPVVLQPAVAPIDNANLGTPSRLEQILSARAGTRLKQFGYDQLGRGSPIVVPQAGAITDDYVVGSGDEIVVSLRGQENSEFRATVDRNGQIVLPRLNPISAGGKALGALRQDIQSAVRRTYVATDAFVTLGRTRQVSVLVSGEVNVPGQRIVTALSTAVDALMLSGGVRKGGSLRRIRLERAGRTYNIDLYGLLTSNGAASSMRLADGDRIVVPALGRTVAVAGLVRQPGIFELAPGQEVMPVRTLLNLAGGLEVRGRFILSVLRILPDGRSVLERLPGETGVVRDSEILFAQLGASQMSGSATLAGGTGLAGVYPIVTGTHLSDLLKAPGALGNSPYTPFGIIVRKDPRTLMRGLVAFTPVSVLSGKEDNTLQGDDIVRILSVNEEQLLSYITERYLQSITAMQAQLRNPLGTESSNSLANQLANQNGQGNTLEDISSVGADIQRQAITALLETSLPGSALARQQQARARALQEAQNTQSGALPQQATAQNPSTMAGAGVPVGTPGVATSPVRVPATTDAQIRDQLQTGESEATTAAAAADPAQNFIDERVGAEQFATNREIWNIGQLARQLGVDPLVLVNFLVDHRARLDGGVHGPGYYFVGPTLPLDTLVEAAGGTVNWADESGVELITTSVNGRAGQSVTRRTTLPLRQNMLASYVVQPHDQLRFPQVFADVGIGSVTVQGEVRSAGTFSIVRGEHLSDLLARAGGLTSSAYPYGAVFLRRSVAQLEHESYLRAANEVQDQLVVAMTRVGNGKLEPNTFSAMQQFVTELRNQRAVGRMTVVADPAVLATNPAMDPLLESGDLVYIPQRPSSISVLGQVLQPGAYPYKAGATVEDYIARAGGYAKIADDSLTFVVLPDGSARKIERSWLNFDAKNLPPGSAIVVPRDITPFDLRQTIIDVSQIFSQFAVSIASIAVLAKQ